jgi:hypothetical protein
MLSYDLPFLHIVADLYDLAVYFGKAVIVESGGPLVNASIVKRENLASYRGFEGGPRFRTFSTVAVNMIPTLEAVGASSFGVDGQIVPVIIISLSSTLGTWFMSYFHVPS